MITLKNVSKTYELKKQMVQAVNDVSVTIDRGEFVVITGRSGSGKTTLLNLVAGLTRPSSGQVLLEDVEVWKLADDDQAHLRNKKLGFVFQFPSLMPSLSVLENVLLPTGFGDGGEKHEQAARERALELLNMVGLSDKLEAFPRQLSAGQQQRVVIARALINNPELILADEPTSDLDEQTEHEVMSLFQSIHQKTGITLLLVTHASELIAYGSRAIRMANGSIVSG